MKWITKSLLILVLALFSALALRAQAPSSRKIPFNNVTTTMSCTPDPSPCQRNVILRMFDAATAGTQVGVDEPQAVSVVDPDGTGGSISFVLGSTRPAGVDPGDFQAGSSRFLDVLDAATLTSVLSGRIELTAGAFAVNPGPQGPQGPQGVQGPPGAGSVVAVTASSPLSVTNPTTTPNVSLTGMVGIGSGGTDNATYNVGKFLAFDGSRLSSTNFDASTFAPASGSGSYIQNLSTPQIANFNITGNGAMSALTLPSTINATTGVINIGSTRFAHGYGPNSTFVGPNAGSFTLNPSLATNNTGVGNNALAALTEGDLNVAVGSGALSSDTTGRSNVAVGYSALVGSNAFGNTGLGAFALQSNTGGTQNTAIGLIVLGDNTTGSNNTAIGYAAGGVSSLGMTSNTTGSNNTFIGYKSHPTPGLTNATAIGANAVVSASNALVLGDFITSVGIGTSAPNAKLEVSGTGGILVSGGGAYHGDGSGLTNVSVSGLAAGTYPNTYTFPNSGNSFTGSFSGSGSALNGVIASGLAAGAYGNVYNFSNAGNSFNGIFAGDGSGVTGLNASNLSSGVVPSGRLSGTYPISIAGSSGAFTGSLGGDVVGSQGSTIVSRINGSPLGSLVGVASGNILRYNGTAWVPSTAVSSVSAGIGIAVSSAPNATTISNTGVLSVGATSPLGSSGGVTPSISLTGTVPVANGGTGTSSATGTGSVVLSNNPTLSGTLIVPTVNASTGYQINGLNVYTLASITYLKTVGAFTYSPPAGTRAIEVECLGGGGGGGGAQGGGASAAAGGGGGGGYGRRFISSLAGTYLGFVGAGGAGATAGANFGGNGGDTQWDTGAGGSIMSCSPGGGGEGALNGVAPAISRGGDGGGVGLGLAGDISFGGDRGEPGIRLANHVLNGGKGASSRYGGGGFSQTGAVSANGFGAGGSGAVVNFSSVDLPGGAGSQGIIIIREYK